jgi:F-type H+-transporting ATPase subunit delta
MNTGIISGRYAKAIFQYASEHGEETLLYEEMKTLSKQFITIPLLKKVLDDPTVSVEEKVDVLITAVGKKVSNTYKHVMRTVVINGRAHHVQFIALKYEEVYRQGKNIVIVKLTTTEPASQAMKEALVELIHKGYNEEVDFESEISNDIIGGFILEVEDSCLDASVKNQLNRMKLELVKK